MMGYYKWNSTFMITMVTAIIQSTLKHIPCTSLSTFRKEEDRESMWTI